MDIIEYTFIAVSAILIIINIVNMVTCFRCYRRRRRDNYLKNRTYYNYRRDTLHR